MDYKIKNRCSNCTQLYYLENESSGWDWNLPLLLSCGHTICEICSKNLTKIYQSIQCKVCLQCMKMNAGEILMLAADKSELYELFPINFQVLGKLTRQLIDDGNEAAEPMEECFIDIEGLLMDQAKTYVECVECHIETDKICKSCDKGLCETCFKESHEGHIIFKHHTLQEIVSMYNSSNNCKVHERQLDYYCMDCSKRICTDCLLISKSCNDHNVKTTSQINKIRKQELMDIQPKVDETFRRLMRTALDIDQQLFDINNGIDTSSDVTQIIKAIEQHTSKLCAIIQHHEKETTALATKLTSVEKESLVKAKNEVFDALKKGNSVMKMISAIADTTQFGQVDLSVLLEDAKKVAEAPWYLLKVKDNTNNAITIKAREDLNMLVGDYFPIKQNAANWVYKLFMPEDLERVQIPPPRPEPVYPTQLSGDERNVPQAQPEREEETPKPFYYYEHIPMYRMKSSTVNFLDSDDDKSSEQSSNPEDTSESIPLRIPTTRGRQPREPFVEGSQELVFVSHIVNPHDFFVQRVIHQKLVKRVMYEHRNADSKQQPLLCDVTKGKIFVTYCRAEKMWMRGRVVSVSESKCEPVITVFCFDFGNIEKVSIDMLRVLSPARWHKPPPLAIHCSLANCKPINNGWTYADSFLMHHITNAKTALINVRRVIETEEDTKLECDFVLSEQNLSLAHTFVFHERAEIINPRLKYPIISTVDRTPEILITNKDFIPKSIHEIYVMHIQTPDKFYIMKKQHQSVYYNLSKKLNKEYSLKLNCGKIFRPELGMACVVNTKKDWHLFDINPILKDEVIWARCVVTEISKHGRVCVQLIDFGLHLMVHWSSLRAIEWKFTKLKALATECHLVDVTYHNTNWKPEMSAALMKKYQNHVLEIEVKENGSRSSIGVWVFDKTNKKNVVCLNYEMVKYILANKFE